MKIGDPVLKLEGSAAATVEGLFDQVSALQQTIADLSSRVRDLRVQAWGGIWELAPELDHATRHYIYDRETHEIRDAGPNWRGEPA